MDVIVNIDWEKAKGVSKSAYQEAATKLLEEMMAEIIKKSSVSGYGRSRTGQFTSPSKYTPSKPGEYPRKQTGTFVEGFSVAPTPSGGVGLYSNVHYAIPLEEGDVSQKRAPRPWLTLTLSSKDWGARLTTIARRVFGRGKK